MNRWCRWVALSLCLALAGLLSADDKAPAKKGIEGVWEGALKVGAIELRLVFHISKKGDDYSAKMDSPDQGAKGIPLDSVEVKADQVKLESKKPPFAFVGKLNKDATAIEGEWKQGPSPLPLTVKRVTKATVSARPQTPKKPYPYIEEEVSYENKKAGVKLAGALTLPKGKGPFPAVLLITGSGAQDRDETIFEHKPFLVLADHLTRNGVAVLRVDDRGVGGSTGNLATATSSDFAEDVLAGVAFLKARKEIDSRKIGLMGHSEGGIIAPLAASMSPDVAFIVMLAGTGLPGEDILYLQGQAVLKAMGAEEKQLATQKEIQQILFAIVKEEKDNDKAKKRIDEAMTKKLPDIVKDEKERKALVEAMEGQTKMLLTPWFRHFMAYDPRPSLKKVKVPVLALCGEKDVQVLPKENNEAIEAALKAGGNKDYTVKQLPGLNHLFQNCKTGAVTEYGKIEESFDPATLKLIGEWIKEKTKGG